MSQVICEYSNMTVDRDKSHSIIAVLQKVTKYTLMIYQCNLSLNMVDRHTYQHWFCIPEYLQKGMEHCIYQHYSEDKLYLSSATTNLADLVLDADLKCKITNTPLTKVAYRFCLTRAFPYMQALDKSSDIFEEWCSTLELAKKNAIDIIKSYDIEKATS